MSRLSPILFFQNFSSPFWDQIAIFLANAADFLFIAALALIFWCIDRKKGEKLAYMAITNMLLGIFIKDLVRAPRPIGQKNVRTLATESAPGYSFPSTHTQTFANLTTSITILFKKHFISICLTVLSIAMGISRLYAGVHYLADVLGGIIIGIVSAFGSFYAIRKVHSQNMLYLITAGLAALFLLFHPSNEYIMLFFGFLAFWGSCQFEKHFVKFETNGTFTQKTIRFLLGMLLLLFINILLKMLPFPALLSDILRYCTIVFVTIGIYPLIIKKYICIFKSQQ